MGRGPESSSVDDPYEQEQYWEFMGNSGTHSIIDVVNVVPVDFAGEEFGTIRPLSDAECIELFGVVQPGRADFMPLSNSERLHEYVTRGRWTGRAAVLWTDGAPAEIAFWGYSGDLKARASGVNEYSMPRPTAASSPAPSTSLSSDGPGVLVEGVILLGVGVTACAVINIAEHRRREAAGMGAVTNPGLLDRLLDLPTGIPVIDPVVWAEMAGEALTFAPALQASHHASRGSAAARTRRAIRSVTATLCRPASTRPA